MHLFIALSRTPSSAGLWPLVASRAMTIGCYLLIALSTRYALRAAPEAMRMAAAGGFFDVCANTCYLLSVRGGVISLSATLTSLYPASTVLLAGVVLRERIGRWQAVGLGCALGAVLLITHGAQAR